MLHQHEAGVVASALVLGPGVAEPDDHLGHYSSAGSAPASPSSPLPFLMTSGSSVVGAATSATTSARLITTDTMDTDPSCMISPLGTVMSDTWIAWLTTRLVTSTSM